MNKTKRIAAIDIGTTKIVALLAEQDENGKIELLASGETPSTGVKRGVVLNIEETVNGIKSAVAKAMNDKPGIMFDDVYVGIAGQHIKSIRNRGAINTDSYENEITAQDVEILIDSMRGIPIQPGEEIVHILPQNFIVDNETDIPNPVGMSGKRLEANFHIVIGQIAAANNIKKCIKRANLKVNQLILEPLASSRAVLNEAEKEVGVALVDIGGGTTDIAIYYEGIIRHTAVIPFGGFTITKDIKTAYSLLESQAEQLKIQYGSAIADKSTENVHVTVPGLKGREPKEISVHSLAYVINARMEEILGAIHYHLEMSGYFDKLGAGIVITGGGSQLKNLTQLASFIIGKDVKIGIPNEHIKSEVIPEINSPRYATGIGLLLMGLESMSTAERLENAVEEEIEENTESVEEDIQKETPQKTGTLFSKLKTRIDTFFDENDEKI